MATVEEDQPKIRALSSESLSSFDQILASFRYNGHRQQDETRTTTTTAATTTSPPAIATSKGKKKRKKKSAAQEDKLQQQQPETPGLLRRSKKNKTDTPSSYVLAMVDGEPKLFSKFFPLPSRATDAVILPKRQVKRKTPRRTVKRRRKEKAEEERCEKKKERKRSRQRSQLSAAEKMSDVYRRVDDYNTWEPPSSCHNLLQERHSFDPWRVLVICMLLNITTGKQVRKVLPGLFLLCPNAEAAVRTPVDEIEKVIQTLGLQKKRAQMIKRFSEEYLDPGWTHVTQLHGIGKYAADAYAIFCVGKADDVVPEDHKLVDYWRFVCDLPKLTV